MIYWDTSCVIKLYTAESDSQRWEDFALQTDDTFASSTLLDVEMACALEQKEARGNIKRGSADRLHSLFRKDVSMGRFTLYPMGSDVQHLACELAATCYHAPDPVHLRTLDALHLATARLMKARLLATTDLRMKVAAPLCGLTVA